MSDFNNDYNDTPKTIAGLKTYMDRTGLSSVDTRFFIGIDYKEPRAFGIYKDESTGNFVVYKNKSDGSRTIRYNGPDEAFAVSELYDRLHVEIDNQRTHFAAKDSPLFNQGSRYNLSNIDSSEFASSFRAMDEAESNNSRRNTDDNDDSYFNYNNNGNRTPLKFLLVALMLIMFLLICHENDRSSSSYGSYPISYDSNYYRSRHHSSYNSYSSYDSHDSWSSSDWDSGYTDWDSDW